MPRISLFTVTLMGASLAACGGGGGGDDVAAPPQPPASYTIGGTLSGLAGTGLVLRNNGGNDLSVPAMNNMFTFSTPLSDGTAYDVTVATQPSSPSQTCTVTGGRGTVTASNVSTVQVVCATNGFTVGATVTGLDADGLVLQNNGGNEVSVVKDGAVMFPGHTLSGQPFSITVKTQPRIAGSPWPAQLCTVANGNGTVGDGPVDVSITCAAPVYKYLYVANRDANSLSAYSVDARTGELTAVPGSPFAADVRPYVTVQEPSGRFAYTSNRGDDTNPPRLSAYTVDTMTGTLTPIAGQPFLFSVTPQAPNAFNPVIFPIIHRSGAFAYAATQAFGTGAAQLFGIAIDSQTGALTEINGFPMDIGYFGTGLSQDSAGRIGLVSTRANSGALNGEIRTFAIHSPSGTLTPIGTFPTVSVVSSAFFMPGDDFVLSLGRSARVIEIFAVDKSGGIPSGVLTAVGPPVSTGAPGSTPFYVAVNRRNHVFYVTHFADADPAALSTFRLDANTGAVNAIGTPISTNSANLAGAILHPSGRFLLQHNNSTSSLQVFAIDPTTFAPTLLPDPTPMPSGVLLDVSGKYLYTPDPIANTISSYRFDTTTGAITLVGTVAAPPSPTSISPWGFQPQ